MSTDADLVRRCLSGDRVAWTSLLARYSDLAYALLRRAGLDASAADDAFQEVAILLWRNLRRLRDVERLASWVGTTTRRVAWRARKQSRRRASREERAARVDRAPTLSPDDSAASVEEEHAMRAALDALGERCRALLSLLYFQSVDASYDEVSRRLGIPRGSIGPTRQRCLDALREDLLSRGLRPDVSEPTQRDSAPVATPRRRRTQGPR